MYKTKPIIKGNSDPDIISEIVSQSFSPYGGNGVYFKEVCILVDTNNPEPNACSIECKMSNGDHIKLVDNLNIIQISSESFGIVQYKSHTQDYSWTWEIDYDSIFTLYSHLILSTFYNMDFCIPQYLRERIQ